MDSKLNSKLNNRIREARRLFDQAKYVAAEQAWQALSNELEGQRRLDAKIIVAACQQALGQRSEAVQTLKDVVAVDKSRAEAWFQLGRAQRLAGQGRGATEALGQAILLDPNHALARVELGHHARSGGDVEGSERHYRTALRANPDCAPAMTSLAALLLDQGKVEEAYTQASRAVKLRPQNPEGQLVLARAFERKGHPDFAQRCLENALRAAPDHVGLHRARVDLLLSSGHLPKAMMALTDARQRGLRDGRLQLLEARILHQMGERGQARHAYESLRADHPEQLDAMDLFNLAELSLGAHELQAAAELAKELDTPWPAASRFIRAQLLEPEGRFDEAAELLHTLLEDEYAPIQRQARIMLAHLELRRGRPQEVQAALQPLLEAERASPFVHWLMARALDKTALYSQALEHLRQAGWRNSTEIAELLGELGEEVYDQLRSFDFEHWPQAAPEDGYPRPVFLLGWPGSGRDQLLEALVQSAGTRVLDRDDAPRRREAMGLPATLEKLDSWTSEELLQARKLYFRAGDVANRSLEPLWLPFAALPFIARLFPGSVVLIVDADERDMELGWHFSGLRNLDQVRQLWRREQAVLEPLLAALPLEFEVLSLADLQKDPQAAAHQLASLLELEDVQQVRRLGEAIGDQLATLTSSGHWRHYAGLFEPV